MILVLIVVIGPGAQPHDVRQSSPPAVKRGWSLDDLGLAPRGETGRLGRTARMGGEGHALVPVVSPARVMATICLLTDADEE